MKHTLLLLLSCSACACALSSCSSPFAGADAFEQGLAKVLEGQGLMAAAKAHAYNPELAGNALPPLEPLQAPRSMAPSKPKPKPKPTAKPVKRYPEEPDDDGKFLPLPVEGPALAEPASLGGGVR